MILLYSPSERPAYFTHRRYLACCVTSMCNTRLNKMHEKDKKTRASSGSLSPDWQANSWETDTFTRPTTRLFSDFRIIPHLPVSSDQRLESDFLP